MIDLPISDQILVALRRIIRAVDLHSQSLSQKHHLTGPQLVVLRKIIDHGELTIGQLAKRVSLSPATVTGIVDRLEMRQWVTRKRNDNDRRQVFVSVTRKGLTVSRKAPRLLQERFVDEFEKLSNNEQGQILDVLNKIARLMGAEDLDAAPVLTSMPVPATVAQIKSVATPKKMQRWTNHENG